MERTSSSRSFSSRKEGKERGWVSLCSPRGLRRPSRLYWSHSRLTRSKDLRNLTSSTPFTFSSSFESPLQSQIVPDVGQTLLFRWVVKFPSHLTVVSCSGLPIVRPESSRDRSKRLSTTVYVNLIRLSKG